MAHFLDEVIDRTALGGINQWTYFGNGILPRWIADMDFRTPQPIRDALQASLDLGVLGYELPDKSLLETVCARLERLYGWNVSPEMVIPVQSVNVGMRVVASLVCKPGEGLLIQPPVFYHFIKLPDDLKLVRQDAPLRRTDAGQSIEYEFDLDAVRAALDSRGARTAMILICNPHNPVGRAYPAEVLKQLATICTERDIILCSDDIHNELLLDGSPYKPIASLAPEAAERIITFIGPGKAFNMSGLHCAFAIIPQADLRQRFTQELERLVLEVNSLGLRAAQAAYSGACDNWLAEVCAYLTANRNYLADFLKSELPGLKMARMEATYLAWIDCSELVRSGRITEPPDKFFFDRASVALHDGPSFGPGGEDFVRLNFACPRPVLEDCLTRMARALARL